MLRSLRNHQGFQPRSENLIYGLKSPLCGLVENGDGGPVMRLMQRCYWFGWGRSLRAGPGLTYPHFSNSTHTVHSSIKAWWIKLQDGAKYKKAQSSSTILSATLRPCQDTKGEVKLWWSSGEPNLSTAQNAQLQTQESSGGHCIVGCLWPKIKYLLAPEVRKNLWCTEIYINLLPTATFLKRESVLSGCSKNLLLII